MVQQKFLVSYSCHDQIKNLSNSIIEGGGSNLGIGIKGISILIMPISNSPIPNESESNLLYQLRKNQ